MHAPGSDSSSVLPIFLFHLMFLFVGATTNYPWQVAMTSSVLCWVNECVRVCVCVCVSKIAVYADEMVLSNGCS